MTEVVDLPIEENIPFPVKQGKKQIPKIVAVVDTMLHNMSKMREHGNSFFLPHYNPKASDGTMSQFISSINKELKRRGITFDYELKMAVIDKGVRIWRGKDKILQVITKID